jgi:hypothetical protein
MAQCRPRGDEMHDKTKPVQMTNGGIINGKDCFSCRKKYACGRYSADHDYFDQCIECMNANPTYTKEIERVLKALFERDHAEKRSRGN